MVKKRVGGAHRYKTVQKATAGGQDRKQHKQHEDAGPKPPSHLQRKITKSVKFYEKVHSQSALKTPQVNAPFFHKRCWSRRSRLLEQQRKPTMIHMLNMWMACSICIIIRALIRAQNCCDHYLCYVLKNQGSKRTDAPCVCHCLTTAAPSYCHTPQPFTNPRSELTSRCSCTPCTLNFRVFKRRRKSPPKPLPAWTAWQQSSTTLQQQQEAAAANKVVPLRLSSSRRWCYAAKVPKAASSAARRVWRSPSQSPVGYRRCCSTQPTRQTLSRRL